MLVLFSRKALKKFKYTAFGLLKKRFKIIVMIFQFDENKIIWRRFFKVVSFAFFVYKQKPIEIQLFSRYLNIHTTMKIYGKYINTAYFTFYLFLSFVLLKSDIFNKLINKY